MKKKVLSLLILLIIMFCGIGSVDAAVSFQKGDGFTKNNDNKVSVSGLTYGNGTGFSVVKYHFTRSGENFVGYCLDPNVKGSSNLRIDRILGDPTMGENVRAHDYGLLEIIKSGYNQYNTSFSDVFDTPEASNLTISLSGDDLYAATNIAIRAWTLGFFQWGKDADDLSQYLASAMINLGIGWASFYPDAASLASGRSCKGTSEEAATCFRSYVSSTYGSWFKSDSRFSWNSSDVTGRGYKVIYVAQRLFRKGIEAAANFKTNGVNVAEVTTSNPITDKISQTEEYVYVDFTIKNMPENGKVDGITFNCPQCSGNGVTYQGMEYQGKDGQYHNLTSSVDISKEISSSNRVRVRWSFTKNENITECNTSSWTLNYNVTDPSQEYIGALLKDLNNVSKTQRFVILTKNDVAPKTVNGNIGCYQPTCETEITVPVCSYDEDDATSSVTAPSNIKRCILENEDEAGNTYQLSEDNGGVDNSYCSVFCKEDYAEIQLTPKIKDVKCGGYFKLYAHIDGSKDCYTSGGSGTDFKIDREKFIADIVAAQTGMIESYNDYLRAVAGAGNIKVDEDKYTGEYKKYHTCGENETPPCFTCDSCDSKDGYESSGTTDGYSVGLPDANGKISVSPATIQYSWEDKDGSGHGCIESCNVKAGTYANVAEQIEAARREAIRNINDYYEDFYNAVRNYNGCTTAWINEFKFEQQLRYAYAEQYYDLLSDEQKYLRALQNTLEEESEIEVCFGNVSDEYKCLGNSAKMDNSDIEESLDYNTYTNNRYDRGVFTNRSYVTVKAGSLASCSDDNCRFSDNFNARPTFKTDDRYDVSNATYVRKTQKKSQDYMTPTVFYQIYPSGKITTNGGYQGSSLQLNALEGKLPVATQTVGGGYFKIIIQDLGEFYDDGDLGRLFDFEGDREQESIANYKDVNSDDTFNGEYYCMYESPCRPNDCPNCDFTCEEDSCEFTPCPECVIDCTTCIFDLYELQTNFKVISTNNFGSANREYGYNWNINTHLAALSLIADKAETTIDEIVENNDTIYDDKTTSDSSLAFSIKLTPNVTNYIKAYNDQIESQNIGGYANDSLTCYDYNGYANILCYSDFLDELIDEFDGDGIITVRNRTNVGERASNPNSLGYWTLWDGYVYNESVIGGPSWK